MTLSFLPQQIMHWPVDRLNPFARNAVINPSAVDAGGAITGVWCAWRMPRQRRAVEGEVIRRLGERGWAVVLICDNPSMGSSKTTMAHKLPRPGGAPVAGMS